MRTWTCVALTALTAGLIAAAAFAYVAVRAMGRGTLSLSMRADAPLLGVQTLPGCSSQQLRRMWQQVTQFDCKPFGPDDPHPRALVTGGAGFVGGHLIKELRRRGVKSIKLIDNFWRGRLSNLCDTSCDCVLDLADDVCYADLTKANATDGIFEGPDIVYHLADVVAGIGFVFDNQRWLFRQNVLINTNVLTATVQSTTIKDYIYVGTACSFPLELQSSYAAIALHESQTYPAHPESAYGWSKLMGEYEAELLAAKAGQKPQLNVGLLRFHNLFGPRSQYADKVGSQALPAMVRKALHYPNLEGYELWGSGKQYRDFLYIDDAVSGVLAMQEHGMNQGVIQVGTGVPTTLLHAAEIVQRLTVECLKKDMTLKTNPSMREGDRGRVAYLDRARSILHWEAKVSIEEGLARMYRWILEDMSQRQTLEGWMLGNTTSVPEALACLEQQANSAQAGPRPEYEKPTVPDGMLVWPGLKKEEPTPQPASPSESPSPQGAH